MSSGAGTYVCAAQTSALVEQERVKRRLELMGLTVVVLITLYPLWKAMQAG
jgi:hypothetical protein